MTAVGEPALVGATETTISTDFALLHVVQEGCGGQAETQVFATSLPGEIALRCGTKFAMPTVRLERWDSQPPPVAGRWEDFDEIPFREREDRGALVITGFDPEHPEEPQLEVAGLGRARVQIFARGRHVAAYGDGLGDQPEDWLLRVWPDPDYHDALWGGPRSIKGLVENELLLSGGRAYVSAAEVSHILRFARSPTVS
jgi:hypothetical protein